MEHLASLDDRAPEEHDDDVNQRALQDLVALVGGLTLARATAGDPISEELLAAARDLLSH